MLLDEITKLKYEGMLPKNIEGHRCNTIVRMYQEWMGTSYVPPQTHPSIQWSITDPFDQLPDTNNDPWCIVHKGKHTRKDQDT